MDEIELLTKKLAEAKIRRFEQYKEEYEGGMLTQPQIADLIKSSQDALRIHIKKYKWNITLAIKNYNARQKAKKQDIIREHKYLYTEKGYSIDKLANVLGYGANMVRWVARAEKWEMGKCNKGKYVRTEKHRELSRLNGDKSKPKKLKKTTEIKKTKEKPISHKLKSITVQQPKPTPVKTKIEHNQFKKLAPKSNIEWSDEIAPEIKIKRKVKEKDFDPIEYANKLIKEREKQNITIWKKKR